MNKVSFKTNTSFLGKNGMFKCTGVNVTRADFNNEKPYITIAPITSKEVIGRCMIRVPVENIPDLIKLLQEKFDENLPENIEIPPDKWLKEQFEYSYCENDTEHHTETPLKVSTYIINDDALKSQKAKVIKSDISLEEYDKLATELGFTEKIIDPIPLAGYYYVNEKSETLVTCATCYKKDDIVEL